MRRLGHKKTKTKVEGHQQCGTCHPYLKSGRARENALWRRLSSRDYTDGACSAP